MSRFFHPVLKYTRFLANDAFLNPLEIGGITVTNGQNDEFGDFIGVMQIYNGTESAEAGPSRFDEQNYLFPGSYPSLPPVPGLNIGDEVYAGGEPSLQDDANELLSFSEGTGCYDDDTKRSGFF